MTIILRDKTELPILSVEYQYHQNIKTPGYLFIFDYSAQDNVPDYVSYLREKLTYENTKTLKLVLNNKETHTFNFTDIGFFECDTRSGILTLSVKLIP